ncbi:TonB-dependent receptor [Cupriavidus oxalaticus]|uniref:TonB-dependent receptor n=1 Tax=Cupriavidus oxalaticus TaxID=96344 RepID=UPI00317DC873
MSVIVALALALAAPVRDAAAQAPASAPVSAPVSALASAPDSRMYAITAGPLDSALIRFAQLSGIDIAYDAAMLGRLQSPGLRGRFTIPDGLRELLADSGLEAVALPDGGYRVRKREGSLAGKAEAVQTLPTVTVSGSMLPGDPATVSGGQLARVTRLGLLGNTDVMDAPVSTVGYTAQAIQDQQARTVGDMIESDASVRSVSKPGGILDAYTIRGFPFSNGNFGEIAFDGMYGVASNYRVSTGYVERIELIKGPAAVLTGMAPGGSVGGGINIVPKRATGMDATQIGAGYASAAQIGGSVDLSRRFGPKREFGVRFNGGYRSGDTGLDQQSRRAGVGALALDYQDSRLRATLDAIVQRESIAAPSRLLHIVPGIGVPDAPDGRRNISQSWESSGISDQSALLRAAYQFSEQLEGFVHAGGGRTRVARLFAIAPTIVNEQGDVAVFDTNYRFNVARASAETGLRGTFDTGPVRHRIGLAFSGYRDQLERGLVNSSVTSLTNIYAPVTLPPQSIAAPDDVPKISQTTLSGMALVDTLTAWDSRLQLTLGLRYQRIRSDNFGPDGATTARYGQGAVTPMLGVVVHPHDNIALYANRIEGLSKGDTAPTSATNAGEVFAPYRAIQYELGAKAELGRLIATASVFQIKKPGGEMSGGVFAVGGEQRNRGIELGFYGAPLQGIRVNASAMWLDATITRSSVSQGKVPIGAPSLQGNFGVEWDTTWLPGLTLTGAMAYTGGQYVDAANTQRIPAWTRFDLGLRYRAELGQHTATFRISVRNVLNRRGWAAVDAYGGLAPADPRTVLASVAVDL